MKRAFVLAPLLMLLLSGCDPKPSIADRDWGKELPRSFFDRVEPPSKSQRDANAAAYRAARRVALGMDKPTQMNRDEPIQTGGRLGDSFGSRSGLEGSGSSAGSGERGPGGTPFGPPSHVPPSERAPGASPGFGPSSGTGPSGPSYGPSAGTRTSPSGGFGAPTHFGG